MRGTVAVSWGKYGGFYTNRGHCPRICLGWVALTFVPVEIDDLMDAYALRGSPDTPPDVPPAAS